MAVGIWPDTSDQASGTTYVQQMEMSGMFVSSIGYNFPLEDNFTEDVTLVGNDKAWVDVDDPTQRHRMRQPDLGSEVGYRQL